MIVTITNNYCVDQIFDMPTLRSPHTYENDPIAQARLDKLIEKVGV